MPDTDFERAIAAAQQGDETSFVLLFRAVQPLLLRYLRVLDGALADDVASETWLAVVKGLGRFKGDETGFRAWAFTIARARLVDARRRAARSDVPVDAEAALASRTDDVDVVEQVGEIFSTEAALVLVSRLPRGQAEAVFLRHVVGLDVSRTAKVLGKRPGAVRLAAHRGLDRLAEMLEARQFDAAEAGCNEMDQRIGY